MHLNDGQLRAYLDREHAEAERLAAENHLASCDDCRTRADEFTARSERVAAHLAVLAPLPSRVSPQSALARFKEQRLRKEIPLMKKILGPRYRPAWGLLTVIALLVVSLSFAPVRAWAERLLAQFRVERITVLAIDSMRMSEVLYGSTITKQFAQILSDSMKVTKEPSKPQVVTSAAQATQMAGFTVRLPTSRADAPRLTVQGGGAFEFTVNRARTQRLLNEIGYSRLQLPASLDGALVKVYIPLGVTAAYGECPRLDNDEAKLNAHGSPGRTMLNCVVLAEIPSPTVDTPPNVNLKELAEIGLQTVAGMTAEQAHAYAQTVDWTTTLVVPIPRNSASSKQVQVDDVAGYLIQRPLDDAPQYALIWVKDGIIYAIGGLGNDTATALSMGNSLK